MKEKRMTLQEVVRGGGLGEVFRTKMVAINTVEVWWWHKVSSWRSSWRGCDDIDGIVRSIKYRRSYLVHFYPNGFVYIWNQNIKDKAYFRRVNHFLRPFGIMAKQREDGGLDATYKKERAGSIRGFSSGYLQLRTDIDFPDMPE